MSHVYSSRNHRPCRCRCQVDLLASWIFYACFHVLFVPSSCSRHLSQPLDSLESVTTEHAPPAVNPIFRSVAGTEPSDARTVAAVIFNTSDKMNCDSRCDCMVRPLLMHGSFSRPADARAWTALSSFISVTAVAQSGYVAEYLRDVAGPEASETAVISSVSPPLELKAATACELPGNASTVSLAS